MAFKMKGYKYPGKSPAKNYKNPQDYKVFNMGNKPSPMKEKEVDPYAPGEYFNYATEGRGDKKRFKQRKGSTGSTMEEVRWIRDNYGTGLNKKELRKAQMAYYDTYKPEEKMDEEVYPQVEPTPREKEKRYPTNPDDRQAHGFLPIDEVWDPTVNEGEGGYVRVEPTEVDPNEEIPEFEGDIIVD